MAELEIQSKPKQPSVPMAWCLETLNKRVGSPYNIPLKELFLVVPYIDEAEFEFRLGDIFNKDNASQGHNLVQHYPNLAKALIKTPKIRVFFVSPHRCDKNMILWKRKYAYPKVNKTKSISRMLAETVMRHA